MTKKRILNMNIHHKNMKQAALDMQQWVQQNISDPNIYECSYSYYNYKEATFMSLPCEYRWYCDYMENSLDLLSAYRIQNGSKYWDKDSHLHQSYATSIQKIIGERPFYKLDILKKHNDGYEMLAIGSFEPIAFNAHLRLNQLFSQLTLHAAKIRRYKKNICLDLKQVDEIKSMHQDSNLILNANTDEISRNRYQKSKFDQIVLTAKELLYIECLMMGLTQKEIALKQQCTETAVRNIILNIKRKLNLDYAPISQVFHKLKQIGALEVCAKHMFVSSFEGA
jgi:DNA-binding CsgD family transcriptional regulator